MTIEINPWEIKLKVYKTGERGREIRVTSYNGEFDVRGVVRGLREENRNMSTEDWLNVKSRFYKNLFNCIENKVREHSATLWGEGLVWDICVNPLGGIPEYSFGQGSIYITLVPEKSNIENSEVTYLLSGAIIAAIEETIENCSLGIKRAGRTKSKRYPITVTVI